MYNASSTDIGAVCYNMSWQKDDAQNKVKGLKAADELSKIIVTGENKVIYAIENIKIYVNF